MLRRVDAHDVFVVTHGSGRPLVTLHGGPGLDHTHFRPWLDPLGALRTLVYYDLLGSGRSQRDVDMGDGLDPWVDELSALCTSLGDPCVDLFGYSFGGFVALAFALRHPERVGKLILCSSAAALDGANAFARAAERATSDQLEALKTAFTTPSTDDEALRALWHRLLPVYTYRAPSVSFERAFDATSFSARAQNHAAAHCLPTYDLRARVSAIRAPMLVLAGRHDWGFPPQHCTHLASAIPGARLEVFEGSGHILFAEENARFVEVVSSFL
jgi:proline iminopeptidase